MFLHFKVDELGNTLEREMKVHQQYYAHYYPTKDTIVYVFEITPFQKRRIVNPFLEGKYSKIDKLYRARNFQAHHYSNGVKHESINFKILTKHPSLKEYWEHMLGTTLPEGAEVWSRAEKEDEIYQYKSELCQTNLH